MKELFDVTKGMELNIEDMKDSWVLSKTVGIPITNTTMVEIVPTAMYQTVIFKKH